MNQTEDFATSVGRILFAVPFLVFGILHFLQGGAMAGVVPSWMPGSVIWVYLTGAANLVAGISIAADRYVRVVAIALVGMLVSFVLTVHLPGVLAEGSSQMAMTNLLKDVGLAGGALMLLGLTD
jgi:uncharacterized membrane protein